MRLSGRGARLLVFLGFASLLGFAAQDARVLLAVLVVLGVVFVDGLLVRFRRVGLVGGGLSATLDVGGEYSAYLDVEGAVKSVLGFEPAPPFNFGLEGGRLRVWARFEAFGKYTVTSVSALVQSPLGLFSASRRLPLGLEVRVRPRVVRAVLALVGGGAVQPMLGEEASKVRGRGFEYSSPREYMAGDDPSWIDWWATARVGRPYVRERFVEGGGRPLLVYDLGAPSRRAADDLATAFVTTLHALYLEGRVVDLVVHRASRVLYRGRSLAPAEALGVGLKFVLDAVVLQGEDFYELVEPKSLERLSALLSAMRKSGAAAVAEYRRRRRLESPYSVVREMVADGSGFEAGFFTPLTHDVAVLLEVVEKLAAQGGVVRVVCPATPWLGLTDEVEVERLRLSYGRALGAIRRSLSRWGGRPILVGGLPSGF
ncbi:MAG: DUF58 domain-containing protein [Thermoprotei archaeon]